MNQSQPPMNFIRGYVALAIHIALARISGAILQILGDPGTGKTALMEHVAALAGDVLPPDLKRDSLPDGWAPDVFSIYVSQHDDVEFMIPFVHPKSGEYSLVPSPLLTRLTPGYYMIWDECTMKGCQMLMLQACSGKRMSVGQWTAPPGTRIMIGNKAENRNFSFVSNPVLGNRLRQCEWEPIHSEWLSDYAMVNGIHPIIGAGVKIEGQKLFLDYDPKRTRNITPRSITEASDDLKAGEQYFGSQPIPKEVVGQILSMRMPDKQALEFMALFNVMDKMTPYPAIVASPDTVNIPNNASARFMTCVSVARRAIPDDWSQVVEWANRLPIEERGSVLEPILKRYPNLYATPEGQGYQTDKAPLVAVA